MCAFNFPAIALTLGGDQWHLLKNYHLELCRDKAPKVRQSLASSLHEIAKIIGSHRSDECLLEPFSWYIRDQDHIQGAVLENVSTLMQSFGIEAGRHALELLNEAWSDIRTWRRREALAEELGNLSAHFMSNGVAEELLGVLGRAFKDHVAAVREKAGGVVSSFHLALTVAFAHFLFDRSLTSSPLPHRTPRLARKSAPSLPSLARTPAIGTA